MSQRFAAAVQAADTPALPPRRIGKCRVLSPPARMKLQSFQYREFHLTFARLGSGPHTMLAFHGFGRSHRDFVGFTEPWQREYTIYAFDLPYHEGSEVEGRVADAQPWTPGELGGLFAAFLDSIGAERTWLLGYSLGGRVALKLAEVLPQRMAGLYLFAPDGLKANRWYAFLSQYDAGRATFRFLRRHDKVFFRLLGLGRRLGLVDRKMHHFIASQVATPEMQQQVYEVWTFYRHIEPDLETLARVAREFNIALDLFFGRYDKVIPASNAEKLRRLMPGLNLHVLESGHAMLTRDMGRRLADRGLLYPPAS